MGDYADCITKDDKRFDIEGLAPWVEKGNIVESQRIRTRQLFEPVKDKILCLITGNHEESIHLHHQYDFTKNLCRDLDVPYGGYSCFIDLKLHRAGTRNQLVVHSWHGAGCAQTEGARLNRLISFVMSAEANIYLMGHLHACSSLPPERLTLRNSQIVNSHMVATMTGSWLTAYTQGQPASYAEMKGYKPSYIGCPCILIEPDEGKITMEVSQD